MTGNDFVFAKSLFKHSSHFFLDHSCPNLGVDASNKNCMFGNKFLDILFCWCEFSISHFITKGKQK
jgi:hypothetical protein